MFWVEAVHVFTDLILPFDFAKLSRSLPLSQQDFIRVLVSFFHELGLIREKIVKLASTITDNLIDSWLSRFG